MMVVVSPQMALTQRKTAPPKLKAQSVVFCRLLFSYTFFVLSVFIRMACIGRTDSLRVAVCPLICSKANNITASPIPFFTVLSQSAQDGSRISRAPRRSRSPSQAHTPAQSPANTSHLPRSRTDRPNSSRIQSKGCILPRFRPETQRRRLSRSDKYPLQ